MAPNGYVAPVGERNQVTITRTRLTVVPWARWLAADGPLANFEAHVDDGIAFDDLGIVRDDRGLADEVVVDMLCGDGREPCATLVRWASAPNLADRPAGPAGGRRPSGRPRRTRCRSCGGRLAAGEPEFWVTVPCMGAFPPACPLCGGDLPQWDGPRARPVLRGSRQRRFGARFRPLAQVTSAPLPDRPFRPLTDLEIAALSTSESSRARGAARVAVAFRADRTTRRQRSGAAATGANDRDSGPHA